MRVILLLVVLLGITLQVVLGATISARSVPEGGYITIDSASSTFANQYLWDLNANGVFGETGAKATHGDEIGRNVRFQTIGRDGTKYAAGFYPVYLKVYFGSILVDAGQTSVQVTNARPVVTSAGGPYTTTGSSAQLSATASDPGGTPVTILWDLDLDGVFGETGNNAQNGDEVGSPVTFTSEVTERDRSSLVRVRASDGSLLSDIVSTRVTIPGLSSTRRCPCAAIATGNCAAVSLTDTASFSSSLGNTVLTRRSTGARVGGVFRARPVVYDTSKFTGFEFCSTFQVLANERQPATHANDANDGGISFIITTASPKSAPTSIGGNAGLVTRKQSTGVSIRFITTQALVQIGNTNGFPSTNAAVVAGFPSSDKHQHYFSVEYLSGIQLVRVFIDGVKVLETNYNLLDEGILGKGPVFRIYPGIVGSVSAAFSQDITVSTNFQFCTTTLTTILPPTCSVSDCTATQTTDGCNVPVENPTNCGGVSCSTSNIPTTVCSNGQCVGACASNYADCNNDRATDGCETRIDNDIYNCGGCGFSCPQINGAATCVGGVCQPVCSSGFANCDLDITNGCETNTTSDIANCGTCGKSCALLGFSTPRCVSGLCVGNCANLLYKDCNGNANDGCETPVGSNTEQCGACGKVCSSSNVLQRICTGGVCTPACAAGYADCNYLSANDGCESPVSSDVNNCGGCGVQCSSFGTSSVACVAGQCSSLCAAGNANCDNNMRNGCEVSTATNATNCGSCGAVCSSNNVPTPTCNGGVCTGTCAVGYGNCDGNLLTNGCETDLSATILNCGTCGNICSPKLHLSNPTCVPNFSGVNPVASCGGFCDGGWAACPASNKPTSGCTSAELFDFTLGPVPNGRTLQTATANSITFSGAGISTITIPFDFQMYRTSIPSGSTITVASGGAVYMSNVASAQAVLSSCTTPQYVSSTATGSVGIVMPYFSSGALGVASYTTGGTAPNRFLRIQWGVGVASDYVTVTFEETTNAIEFAYSFASFTNVGTTQFIGISDLFFRSNYVTKCTSNTLITGQTGPVFLRFVPATNLNYKPQVPPSISVGTGSIPSYSAGANNVISFGGNNWVQITLAGAWTTPGGTSITSIWLSNFGVLSATRPASLTSTYYGGCSSGGYSPPRLDPGAEFFHVGATSTANVFSTFQYDYQATQITRIRWFITSNTNGEFNVFIDSTKPGVITTNFQWIGGNTGGSSSFTGDYGMQTYYKGAFSCGVTNTVFFGTSFQNVISSTQSNCSN